MAYEGKGKLFTNDSTNEKAPKWKGNLTLLNGEKVKLAAWENEDGSIYLSIDNYVKE